MNEDRVRRWLIVACVLAGLVLVGLALASDYCWAWTGMWPSVFLEAGFGLALVGGAFALERAFIARVRAVQDDTRQLIGDIAEASGTTHSGIDHLTVDVLPTSTEGGQAPKVLVRITDPAMDYQTTWTVELRSPTGAVETQRAFWPGSGPISRARFVAPTSGRSGHWTGRATRERLGEIEYVDFEENLI